MTVSIIAALADDRAIGNEQKLLWRLPEDMKMFKELTVGKAVIMGRKTFESLPKGALPDRVNVVLTKNNSIQFPGAIKVASMSDALAVLHDDFEEVFIIGGGDIYKQALCVADKMYLTVVHHSFPGSDTYFPEIDFREWREIKHEEHKADDRHKYSFAFVEYSRI